MHTRSLSALAVLATPALGQVVSTWTRLTPTAAPVARDSHAVAYDAVQQRVVLFGGESGNGRLGDTWLWDGAAWSQAAPTSSPSPRGLHAMAYDARRGQTVLFGGSQLLTPYYDETWLWDGVSWRLSPTSQRPPGRIGHALAYDEVRERVVLFAGNAVPLGTTNDTWEWDGATWTRRTPAVSPQAREDHALAYHPLLQRTVLFGGLHFDATLPGIVFHDDTWEWDGTSWIDRTPAATNQSPAARASHAMAFDTDRLTILAHGGGDASTSFTDTWEWDGATWRSIASPLVPPASSWAMAFDPLRGSAVLCGFSPDVWEFRSAFTAAYGAGCYDRPTTVYESFAPGAVDLAGQNLCRVVSVRLTPNGRGGYTIAAGSGAWFGDDGTGTANSANAAPGAAPLPGSALAAADDAVVSIDLTSAAPGFALINVPGTDLGARTRLFVSSNGFASIDAAIDPDPQPGVAALLAQSMRWAPLWTDLQPQLQGSMHFDYDAAAAACYLTFVDCPQAGGAGNGGSTFQLAWLPGGVVEYRYASLNTARGPSLVGFSTGRGAPDPGSTDLYDAVTRNVNGLDTGTGSIAPRLHNDAVAALGTTIGLVTSAIPGNVGIGAVLLSFAPLTPGVPLTSLGVAAPGCLAHIDPVNSSSLGLFFPAGADAVATLLALPANPLLAGVRVHCQTALLTTVNPPNPAGVLTTNGILLVP